MSDGPGPAEDRLAAGGTCWLATVRPDGRPHLTPIWFVWVRDRLWMCANATAVKVANARAESRVSVALGAGDDPVVAEGRAAVHVRPYPDDVVAAFRDRFDWDITRLDDEDGLFDALLEVEVDRWLMRGTARPGDADPDPLSP